MHHLTVNKPEVIHGQTERLLREETDRLIVLVPIKCEKNLASSDERMVSMINQQSVLLRSDGGKFQPVCTLPEVPTQVLALRPGDIWEVGSQGVEHGDGTSSGWSLVASSRPAALASDGTNVWWVSDDNVFHSADGPPTAQPVTASAAAGMRLTALAWVASATSQTLWAVLSPTGHATGAAR